MGKNEIITGSATEIDSDIRASYISDLSSIIPMDELEAKDIRETLDWLRTSPTLNKPYNMDRHLGILFLLLSADRKSTLLINHRKAQTWLPPGGHVDIGVTFQDAVVLEMKEELQTEPKFIQQHPFMLTQTLTSGLNAGHVDVTAWFLVEGDLNNSYTVQEKEASESKWCTLGEIIDDSSLSHIARAARKIQAMQQDF